jgi:hypothetical protein
MVLAVVTRGGSGLATGTSGSSDAGAAVGTVTAGSSLGAGGTTVACAALLEVGLNELIFEDVTSVAGGVLAAAANLEHLLPHITGSSLAEVDLDLDGRLQGLYIVEDEGEGDEAPGDGDGAEDDGAEGRLAH